MSTSASGGAQKTLGFGGGLLREEGKTAPAVHGQGDDPMDDEAELMAVSGVLVFGVATVSCVRPRSDLGSRPHFSCLPDCPQQDIVR